MVERDSTNDSIIEDDMHFKNYITKRLIRDFGRICQLTDVNRDVYKKTVGDFTCI